MLYGYIHKYAPSFQKEVHNYTQGGALYDRPPEHHGVIFVRQIVAMSNIRAFESPEHPVHHHIFSWFKGYHVLLPDVIRVIVSVIGFIIEIGVLDLWGKHTFARYDAMLLHVEVHRMDPATSSVLDGPEFGSSQDREGE